MKTEALLTARMLERLKPEAKEYAIHDTGCPGLAARVQPSGTVSWVTWERANAKTRRVTLGRLENLSLEEARRALRDRRAGKPPAPPVKLTFEELAVAFVTAKEGTYRASTLKILRVYLDSQLLPAFGTCRVDRITTPDVAEWFHAYSRHCPGGAN